MVTPSTGFSPVFPPRLRLSSACSDLCVRSFFPPSCSGSPFLCLRFLVSLCSSCIFPFPCVISFRLRPPVLSTVFLVPPLCPVPSLTYFYSQRMPCVFLDNYCRSSNNGRRWQGRPLFFDRVKKMNSVWKRGSLMLMAICVLALEVL